MIVKSTLDFLKELEENNNKEWFNDNKPLYLAAKENVEDTVALFIDAISLFDSSIAGLRPKDCLFRIFKDVRFSKDKTPYKTNFGASITKDGRKSGNAGYYFHLKHNDSFIGGGIYCPPTKALNKVRNQIIDDPESFKGIIESKNFKSYFGEIYGDKLKTAPKGFDKNHPEIELLRHKSYVALHKMDNKKVLDDNFANYGVDVLKEIKELNHYINQAFSK